MTDKEYSLRYWIVNCLGCRNPIPLYAEPVETPAALADGEIASERPFFRAWCTECGREYPYLSESMICTFVPPVDKQSRQIEFTRFRQRSQVRRAQA